MRRIKFLAGLIFCVALSCPLNTAYSFDDISYDISASFYPDEKKIEAKENISFKNTTGKDLKEIYLRVYPNHEYSQGEKLKLYKYATYFRIDPFPSGFDSGKFTVVSISSGGRQLEYSFEGRDKTVLKITIPEALKNGEKIELNIDFNLKIPNHIGRYGWHKETFALNRWYPILGVYDQKGWHNDPDYLLHMPYVSEAALYKLKISLPRDYVLASGCDEETEQELSDGRKEVLLSGSKPMRELSLAISKDYKVLESHVDGIKIKSYYFPRDERYAKEAAVSAKDMLTYYGKRFGKYPYKKFSIAPVYLGYGGSQNAGIVFIDIRAYEMPPFLMRYFDFLVAHETGHQWWYNIVGNDEFRELWLDEGINSYYTLCYLEDKYGMEGKVVDMPSWLENFIPNPTFRSIRTYRYRYFAKKGLDQAILTDLESFYEPAIIFTVAYGKGSSIVDMLTYMLGEEKMDAAMQKYFKEYSFKNATVKDFEKVISDAAGKDMGWFFDEWLYSVKLCDYAVSKEKGSFVLRRQGEIKMPVDTTVNFADGTQEVVHSKGDSKQEALVLPENKKISKVCVDKGESIIDVDRTNNIWPRQVDVRLVPLYYGVYEIPLFLREDAYSWITGPSFSKYGMGFKSSFQKPMDYTIYAATHYDTNSDSLTSSAGFEKWFSGKYLSWGFEFFDREGYSDEERDLKSYKLYIRQELGFPYSYLDQNSHLTLYLVHNQSVGKGGFIGAKEYPQNLNYRQNQETIFGATFFYTNAGAFPDPSYGHKLSITQEVGGHILGGGDSFVRTEGEFDKYLEIAKSQKLAFRAKVGAGYPEDKYLFYLGSDTALRGYDYKDIKGSSMFLGSLEYRFPILEDLDKRLFWQTFNLDQLQGVLFFDAGSAGFDHLFESGFKKDAGIGLRFYFDVAGGAERFALRIDAAWPIDSVENDAHVWVGINHVF